MGHIWQTPRFWISRFKELQKNNSKYCPRLVVALEIE